MRNSGSATICEENRWIWDGVAEYADSIVTNPHKWLFTNFDCDCFWVADRSALIGALSVLPEYLRNAASESGEVIDYREDDFTRLRTNAVNFLTYTDDGSYDNTVIQRSIPGFIWQTGGYGVTPENTFEGIPTKTPAVSS